MTWADRLIHLATGDPQQALRAELLHLYGTSAERAQRLEAHAALAPTAGSEVELRALAGQEAERSGALQQALRERGTEPPAAPAAANHASHNHWSRLVVDLDACREARDGLSRKRADLLGRDASLQSLVDSVLAGLDTQADRLRALIARADPQALN